MIPRIPVEQPMTAVTVNKVKTRHIYQLDALGEVPPGPLSATVAPRRLLSGDTLASGKSTSVGAVVKGERVQVALVHKARGTGSKIHTHANEQFNYVLQGTLIADMDGQVFRVPKGHVVHIPAGMPHSHVASADEDVIFYAIKDTRTGIVGPPVDGVYNGPRHLPGFGLGNNEWKIGASGLPEPQTENVTGKAIQYVYDIANLDAVPANPTSAEVIPRNFISKKSSSFGAALRGEKLQVGHIHKGVGSGTKLHTHPNEQFSFVLAGTMIYQIDDETIEAPPMSVTHLPCGIRHSAIASAAGDVLTFVAKDTSHGMSGPPVDGIEDGPVYLPGFGPKK
jgi:quercetin dioxygenase-like cupin family protein